MWKNRKKKLGAGGLELGAFQNQALERHWSAGPRPSIAATAVFHLDEASRDQDYCTPKVIHAYY